MVVHSTRAVLISTVCRSSFLCRSAVEYPVLFIIVAMGMRVCPVLGSVAFCSTSPFIVVVVHCPIPGVTIEKYKDNANCEPIDYI